MMSLFVQAAKLEVQTLDVISINIWQVLISLINLLIIFFIIKKIVYKPVRKMLANRQADVEKEYADANKARETAEQEKLDYENKIANAHSEASQIMLLARNRAERLEKDIMRDASERAEQMIHQADEEIALERKKAMNDIKDDISTISVDIASKVIGREIKESDHEYLINEFIDGLGDES